MGNLLIEGTSRFFIRQGLHGKEVGCDWFQKTLKLMTLETEKKNTF